MEAEEEGEAEKLLQILRSKATELLLREEFQDSIQTYTQFISLSQDYLLNPNLDSSHIKKLQKSICLAFSNRGEARARLFDFSEALRDCDEALKIDKSHFKTLLLKGKILLNLNRYSLALEYFKKANLDPQANGYLQKCKKLESLSRTGAFDISDWVLSRFCGEMPDLAEYIGAIEIKKSEISGRGLFATKNVESGTLLLVSKAIAVDGAIVPQDSPENVKLVLWENFIDKVVNFAGKCNRINTLISKLSTSEDEDSMEVPDIECFRPNAEMNSCGSSDKLDRGRMIRILDVNSILEHSISSTVLGKNAKYLGIGLWVLASLINHSCDPNVRRLHIGDYVVIHASRDVKAGEELSFAYFNVLSPLEDRVKMANNWGFSCKCKRCKFEENLGFKQERREIEMVLRKGVIDMGSVVYRLEEGLRKWMVRGKGKGYLRASFWEAYSKVFCSDKLMRKWGKKIVVPFETVVDSVVDAVGSDEKILNFYNEGLKRKGINGVSEMEKRTKLGRGIYGKIMKKQAMRTLISI